MECLMLLVVHVVAVIAVYIAGAITAPKLVKAAKNILAKVKTNKSLQIAKTE